MISFVPVEQVGHVWSALEPQIKKALSCGQGDGETLENYYAQLINGDMFMIVRHVGDDISCGAICSIQEHPNKKTLFIELLAGQDLKSWIDEAETSLKEIKAKIGADTIEASCRFGLSKMLKNWTPKAIIMELK